MSVSKMVKYTKKNWMKMESKKDTNLIMEISWLSKLKKQKF